MAHNNNSHDAPWWPNFQTKMFAVPEALVRGSPEGGMRSPSEILYSLSNAPSQLFTFSYLFLSFLS